MYKKRMMGARQFLVEDGWTGFRQLQVDKKCIKVKQLHI